VRDAHARSQGKERHISSQAHRLSTAHAHTRARNSDPYTDCIFLSALACECLRLCVPVCVCVCHGGARRSFIAEQRRAAGPRVRHAVVIGWFARVAAGVTWTSRTTSALWAGRDLHTTVIDAAGAIYVIGGVAGSTYYNDVYVSRDGGADRTRAGVLERALGGSTTRGCYRGSGHSSVLVGYTGALDAHQRVLIGYSGVLEGHEGLHRGC
jgi:hypothetical protein